MVDYTIAVAGLTCRPSSSGPRGEQAKEYPSFYNNYPTDIIEVDNEKVRIRRTCGCGGKLVYDKRAWLYCEKCHLIDNDIDQVLQVQSKPSLQAILPITSRQTRDLAADDSGHRFITFLSSQSDR